MFVDGAESYRIGILHAADASGKNARLVVLCFRFLPNGEMN